MTVNKVAVTVDDTEGAERTDLQRTVGVCVCTCVFVGVLSGYSLPQLSLPKALIHWS